jgi:cytochrome bd-type quinol oxidase subunit 2
METSIFLARLLGPAFIVVGAGLLVNRDNSRALAREFLDSPALIYLAGLIALALGLAIVLTHNVWEFRWPVIVTLFGWVSLVAGILRVVFPQVVTRMGEKMLAGDSWLPVSAILYLVLGAWLSFAGYFGTGA